MTSMEGKVIAITGAASGIGLATAKLLASRGALVSLGDLQAEALKDAQDAITSATPHAKVHAFALDIRDKDAVAQWIRSTVRKFGKLDGAANMAGVFRAFRGRIPTIDEDDESWDFMLGVNLVGMMQCMRAELQNMNDGGSIVNASSILGVQGGLECPAYAASKHGVVGLTRSTAKDVGKRGIRVNCIAPGYIETPMLKRSIEDQGGKDQARAGGGASVPLGRMGQPEEVAFLVSFLLSDESRFITGACYGIDGGWNC